MRSFRNLPAARSRAAWLGALLLLLSLSGWVSGRGAATVGEPRVTPFDAVGGPGVRSARAEPAGRTAAAVSAGAIAVATAGLLAGWPARSFVVPEPRRAAPAAPAPPPERPLPRGPPGAT